uniref:Cytochrome c oxidase subunit 2 n=1 Tax=Stereobalanus canadensis TaxID=560612 RepID=A0A3Q8HCK9_9BILA|nr:cytochrome c oxidase subunit II [Stereobalanus canadensis]AXY64124.1 cytochrome c oxidase subunit 2 [Stereobalanus canadensis]
MEELIYFHDHALVILTLVSMFVFYSLISLALNSNSNRALVEGQEMETIWTLLPAMVIMFLALPSIQILYMMDETTTPYVSMKIMAHQWYWSYEYSDFDQLEFDSYMVPTSELELGTPRLLETDTSVCIPTNLPVRALITSADVIHAWALPSLGLKMDAVPGRLNQVTLFSYRSGVFYGQCSEICGANHSFMPMTLEAMPLYNFELWANTPA